MLVSCRARRSGDDSGYRRSQCNRTHRPEPRHAWRTAAHEPSRFQVVGEALGDRVVPAVALAAHRTLHAVFNQLVLERLAGVGCLGRCEKSVL